MTEKSYIERVSERARFKRMIEEKAIEAARRAVYEAFLFEPSDERIDDDSVCLGEHERTGFAREIAMNDEWSICLEVQALIKPTRKV